MTTHDDTCDTNAVNVVIDANDVVNAMIKARHAQLIRKGYTKEEAIESIRQTFMNVGEVSA